MMLECTWNGFKEGKRSIHSGILISIFFNAYKSVHEAAVLEVDTSYLSGYNTSVLIVPLDNLSVTPKERSNPNEDR